MRKRLLLPLLAALTLLNSAGPSLAVRPDEMLANPALEARARKISAELRCLVCQNQSIDDSDADLAHDLRMLVRDRLKAGDSDTAVIDYLVQRYGEYVLLRPAFNLHTLLLWSAGPLALLGGLVVVWFSTRETRRRAERPLSEAEAARVEALIARSLGDH